MASKNLSIRDRTKDSRCMRYLSRTGAVSPSGVLRHWVAERQRDPKQFCSDLEGKLRCLEQDEASSNAFSDAYSDDGRPWGTVIAKATW